MNNTESADPHAADAASISARSLRIASQVIAKACRTLPADGVLRAELKSAQTLSRADAWDISRATFTYYRWRGWAEAAQPLLQQIKHTLAVADAFAADPERFPDSDLVARSVPAWVTEELEVTAAWARALQREPALWLRARRGQGEALAKKLGRARRLGLPDAVAYEGDEDLFRRPEFHAGEFEIQDIASQAVGWACGPKPGETWWDACAGEGGKMLHLSDLMQNQGLIWASDRAAWRLKRLKLRAARAKAFNYRAVAWDGGEKLPTKAKFDGVLVDAPCSGVGTWQRNPHGRWTTTPEDVRELADVQQWLLAHAAHAVKPGGRLIYAVCTLTRSETAAVATAFSNEFPDFSPWPLANPLAPSAAPAPQLWLWPQETAGNGMFVAGWRRK